MMFINIQLIDCYCIKRLNTAFLSFCLLYDRADNMLTLALLTKSQCKVSYSSTQVAVKARGPLVGKTYLAYEYITTRRCIAYIHALDTTLTFNLNVKFK